MERLDEQKLTVLQNWAIGLERDEREEVSSAGRAILLLIEEVEQLHVELWHARSAATARTPEPEEPEEPAAEDEDAKPPHASLAAALRKRLASTRRPRSE